LEVPCAVSRKQSRASSIARADIAAALGDARGADQGDIGDGKRSGEDDGSGVRDGETMRDVRVAAGCTDEGCGAASGRGNGGIHRTTIHKSRRHGNEGRHRERYARRW
jgi:hypothetical protein